MILDMLFAFIVIVGIMILVCWSGYCLYRLSNAEDRVDKIAAILCFTIGIILLYILCKVVI